MSHYVVGVDVGTSGCKAILIDENAKVIKTHVADYPLSIPKPGWSEQNPADWWDRAKQCLREVVKGTNKADIKGLGLSAQMHGLVALDKDGAGHPPGHPLERPAHGEAVRGDHAEGGRTRQPDRPGQQQHAARYTGGKILWIRENEPENYARIHIMLNPKDYIRYKLTGDFATEVSDASGTGLFNVKDRVWSDKLLSLLDIDRKKLRRSMNPSRPPASSARRSPTSWA